MKVLVQILCLFGLCVVLTVSNPVSKSNGKRLVCYFGSWAVYRYNKAKITANDIDCSLCTHFIYTFIGLNEQTAEVQLLDAYNDIGDEWKVGLLPTLRKKCQASGTKFMVAIGGWNEGSTKYSNVMASPQKRALLKKSIINFVEKYELDGFDLDWEYPGQRGGAANDKENLALFLDMLYPYFQGKGLELSAAVTANAIQIAPSYNVKHFSDHLSFINVMAYDLHGSWESTTGHHTALYSGPSDTPESKHLNIDSAIRQWIDLGADPQKINLGLGTYGRSFTLSNPTSFKIGAAASGIAPYGWIPENGFYGYNEICHDNNTVWTTEWDDVQKVPYAHSGKNWVGYDDPASIAIKTCFAKNLNLGGIMYWSVETDDFAGNCNLGKYPLINAGRNALNSNCGSAAPVEPEQPVPETTISPIEPETTPIEPETTISPIEIETTPVEPETEVPVVPVEPQQPEPEVPVATIEPQQPEIEVTTNKPVSIQCQSSGQMIKDPANCSQYLVCLADGSGQFSTVAMKCASGLVYDATIKACNYRTAYSC